MTTIELQMGKIIGPQDIYEKKLRKLAEVIKDIGASTTGTAPTILGVAEIENLRVLENLVQTKALDPYDYQILHYDSPDRRGIDVALLYRPIHFTPTFSKNYELRIFDSENPDKRVYTRDQLLVCGLLDGDEIFIIVNHWPSRRGGEQRSSYKRKAAANLNKRIIDSIHAIKPYAKIVSMGDLNDDPTSASVKKVLKTKKNRHTVKPKGLYNPMEKMHQKGFGSLAYGDGWNLFDQLLFSYGFLDKKLAGYTLYKTGIYSPDKLVLPTGRYKGYPYRSFANGTSTGGYSDHFPVYSYVIKKTKKTTE